MPSSATARKAAATRKSLLKRQRELERNGVPSDVAEDTARKEHGLGPKKGTSAAVIKQTQTQHPAGATAAPATPAPTPAPATPTPAAATPASSTPSSGPTAGAGAPTGSVGARLRAMASPPQADPALDPLVAQMKQAITLNQPSWEIDGKWFRCWMPGGKKKVQLEIADRPGPYTPTEKIHEILGNPEILFAICVAIEKGEHSMLKGPTGTAKTSRYRWLAQMLNWNLISMPISRGTEAPHMVGEYMPGESDGAEVVFKWTWGPVSQAVLASQDHPTILVFEEINRIGNPQEFSRIYSLLDDTRFLEIKEKRGSEITQAEAEAAAVPVRGKRPARKPATKKAPEKLTASVAFTEKLVPGQLYVGATANPADDENADYNVQELDAALVRRFQKQPRVGYPPEPLEAEALRRRVPGLSEVDAMRMVKTATRIRESKERFPISFPDLVSWGTGLEYYDWMDACEVAVITKAHPDMQAAIRDLVTLNPNAGGQP